MLASIQQLSVVELGIENQGVLCSCSSDVEQIKLFVESRCASCPFFEHIEVVWRQNNLIQMSAT